VLAAHPVDLGPAWAEFSRKPALKREKTVVGIGTLGFDRRRSQLDFWLRRTVTANGIEKVAWADSRTCPAVRPMIAAMRELPVARFAPPGFSEGSPLIMDGVCYSLHSYSDDGSLTVSTNVGTPLASWVEASLERLGPCWTSTIPKRAP
jgi:hypothetical protein